MKATDIDKDIIDLIRIRRLTFCGHMAQMSAENVHIGPIAFYGRTDVFRPRERLRKKWLDNIISYIRTNVLEHTRHTSALTVAQKHNETFQRNSTELKS